MPRYFFHIHDGLDLPDEIGTVLAGDPEARAAAITASAEALRDLGARFWAHPEWQMHVMDEHGTTVCDFFLSNRAGAE